MPYFKRFSKVPYTIDIILSILGWAGLSAALGYFLILSQADFTTTGTKDIFVFTFPLYVILVAFLTSIEYGSLRFFGIKVKERRRELRVLNDNIKNRHILSNLSTKTLKEIFYALAERPRDWFKAVEAAGLVVFLTLLTEWLVSGTTTNLFIILASGLISIFLLVMFANFFAERFIFPTLKECRELLAKRGEKIKEPYSKFNNFRTKLNLLLLIPIIIVLVILIFIAPFNLETIIFSLIGLGMATIISRVLSFSIYQAFLGIRNFAKELPKEEKTLFSTGSLDTEIIDLSEDLNKAANEVYSVRTEIEKSKTVLQERVNELERFYKLTVGRELKMVELKKQIQELKEKLKDLKK